MSVALFWILIADAQGAKLDVCTSISDPYDPCENAYTSVQAAIEDAEDGDDILVYPGTYTESILVSAETFGGESLEIAAAQGGYPTFLDDTGEASVPIIEVRGAFSLQIANIAISTVSQRPMLLSDGASISLDGVYVGSESMLLDGGLLKATDGNVAIVGSTFDGGRTNTNGAHLTLISSSASIETSSFWDGLAIQHSGSIYVEGEAEKPLTLEVLECDFSRNRATMGSGGAILVHGPVDVTIGSSWFTENMAQAGGALFATFAGTEAAPTLSVTDSRFEDNVAVTAEGGALSLGSATCFVDECVFVGNRALGGGGAISAGAGEFALSRSLFCGNTTGSVGGAVRYGEYTSTVTEEIVWTNNRFIENSAAKSAGAVGFEFFDALELRFNHFLGNFAPVAGAVEAPNAEMSFRGNILAYNATTDYAALGLVIGNDSFQSAYNLWYSNDGPETALDPSKSDVYGDPKLVEYTPDGNCDNDRDWPTTGAGHDRGPTDEDLRDLDGTRADIGAYAGPDADAWYYADADEDGVPFLLDCDDYDADIGPSMTETYYDGTDADCDGASDYDADRDGYDSNAYNGQDCDDDDATRYLGAQEIPNDGVDQDCDGEDLINASGRLRPRGCASGEASAFGLFVSFIAIFRRSRIRSACCETRSRRRTSTSRRSRAWPRT